jgi:hypothetical protein
MKILGKKTCRVLNLPYMFYAPVNTHCVSLLEAIFCFGASVYYRKEKTYQVLTREIYIDAFGLFDDTENNVSYNTKFPANVQHMYIMLLCVSCIIFQTPQTTFQSLIEIKMLILNFLLIFTFLNTDMIKYFFFTKNDLKNQLKSSTNSSLNISN